MKPQAILLSAFATTGLFLLLICHHSANLPGSEAKATRDKAGPTSSEAPPAHRMGQSRHVFETPKAAPPDLLQTSEPNWGGDHNHLGIPYELLKDARKIAEDTADRIGDNEAALNDARYHNQSLNAGNPSKKLALRLGLEPEAEQAIGAIFSAALADQIKERMEAERSRLRQEARLLATDRESYVSYLALRTMLAQGTSLSEEQQSFHDRFHAALVPAASFSAAPWYQNPKIIAAMNQQLSPAKQPELAAYVDEQKKRDQETRHMHAQMRANQIAEQLGLGKADQSTLLDYLKENPEAPSSEIHALLPPELRSLLPSGM